MKGLITALLLGAVLMVTLPQAEEEKSRLVRGLEKLTVPYKEFMTKSPPKQGGVS